jgi:hypothetical protein
MEKAKCMLHFKQNHSVTLVQWQFCMNYGKEAPMTKKNLRQVVEHV